MWAIMEGPARDNHRLGMEQEKVQQGIQQEKVQQVAVVVYKMELGTKEKAPCFENL